jgi:hypothetical protein
MKPEQQIQRAILDYLAVKKIWHMRLNTGAVVLESKGRTRMVRYGRPGCADILVSPIARYSGFPCFLWLEVKAPTGKQSDKQKEFEKEVLDEGHDYFVVRSIDDVEKILKEL